MTPTLELGLYIFILAGFLGYHVIMRVPPLLHTPLMSATNAISGISLIGSPVIAGANYDPLSTILGFVAVVCSSTNVVGGFLITDRMLKMFKSEKDRGSGNPWYQRPAQYGVVEGELCGLEYGLYLMPWNAEDCGGAAMLAIRPRPDGPPAGHASRRTVFTHEEVGHWPDRADPAALAGYVRQAIADAASGKMPPGSS